MRTPQGLRGVALACRPADSGTPFAAGLAPIPGAKVAVREMLNGQGYHVEAEIPLAFLPELSQETAVTFKRNYWPGGVRGGTWNEHFTELKRDLTGWRGPIRLDAALHVNTPKGDQRLSWAGGGVRPAPDVRIMSPTAWGLADVPDAAGPIDRFTVADRTDGNALFTADATVRVDATYAAGVPIRRYLISETPESPRAPDPGWSPTPPSSHTITGKQGDITFTLWVETADGQLWRSPLPARIFYSTAPAAVVGAPTITSDLADTGWVRWRTDADCFARVAYRAAGDAEWRTTPLEKVHTRDHRHRLLGLTPGRQYEVEIRNGRQAMPVLRYVHLENYRPGDAAEIALAGLQASASSAWGGDSDAANALTGSGYGWRNNQSNRSWWQVDLGRRYTLAKILYQGRTNDAMIREYNVYVSDSVSDWGAPVVAGEFDLREGPQEIPLLTPKPGRYLRLDGVSRYVIPGYIGIQRLRVFGAAVP